MIKDIDERNKKLSLQSVREEKIKEVIFKFTDKNGNFDYENFKKYIEDSGNNFIKEGYGLNFLGKKAAELMSSMESTTVFVPDTKHNEREENKNSENIYISADNLEALRHLKNSYRNKIKCIYIDPPYNTGSDGFCYTDSFSYDKNDLIEKLGVDEDEAERILSMQSRQGNSHSSWLSFMYARLLIARELLSDDGVIFISIDDNEMANLKLLCDEVFGENDFINNFMWLHGKGKKNKNSRTLEQYILCYAKKIDNLGEWRIKHAINYEFSNPDNDPKGAWFSGSISFDENRSNPLHENYYEIKSPSGVKWTRQWFVCKEEMEDLIENGDIYWGSEPEYNNIPREKVRPSTDNIIPPNIFKAENVGTTRSAQTALNNLFEKKQVFDNPKPVGLIQRLLDLNNCDIILDFFSGSATTGQAIIELNSSLGINNSKFILVQVADSIDEMLSSKSGTTKTLENQIALCDKCGYPHTLDYIGIERIKRAAKKIKEDTGADIDYGFKHYTLVKKVDETEVLDMLEKYDPNITEISQDKILEEFSIESRLITFLCDDGFGLTPKYDEIDLNGYKAYYIEKSLYLLDKGFDIEQCKALVKMIDDETKEINRLVLYGYAFSTREMQQLKDNLEKFDLDDDNIVVKY